LHKNKLYLATMGKYQQVMRLSGVVCSLLICFFEIESTIVKKDAASKPALSSVTARPGKTPPVRDLER
jgi:hypothetical protein